MQTNIVTWTPGMSLESIERQVIVAAYSHYRGNKTATAQSLGIAIRTLDNKLERYRDSDELDRSRKEEVKRRRDEFDKRSRGDVNAINSAVNFQGTPRPYQNKSEKIKTEMPVSQRGEHMESSEEISKEQSVSMRERKEVQEMSSRKNTRGRPKKSSKKLQ